MNTDIIIKTLDARFKQNPESLTFDDITQLSRIKALFQFDGTDRGHIILNVGFGAVGVASELKAAGGAGVTLEGAEPIAQSLGAASRSSFLAKKLGLNIASPTTRQVLNNLDMEVSSFISQFRKGNINKEFPAERSAQGIRVEKALASGPSKVRKLLLDGRFAK